MQTSVIHNSEELYQFVSMTALEFGDPSRSTCLVFVPWHITEPESGLFSTWDFAGKRLGLQLGEDEDPLMLPASIGGPEMVDGTLQRFGLSRINRGVWALEPSLHMPGVLHAFVVVHGVPEPAPWESLIVLATSY